MQEHTSQTTAAPRRVVARRSPAEELRRNWLRILVHIAALVPFALLLWDYYTNNLTANPIQNITQRTGEAGLIILVLSLLCTPLNMLFSIKQVLPLRRPLGLYGFFYIALHLLTFVWLDYGLDWELILQQVNEKRYVLVGFAAFVLLIPLALTSTKISMRRLGKRWKLLHKLVYLAIPLGVLHFFLLVKADVREPILYGVGVALLLALRLPPVRRAVARVRSRINPPRAQKPTPQER